MVEFVKLMAELNQDIKPYVVIGTITAEQYKQFTGKDYAPAAATPAVQFARQPRYSRLRNTQYIESPTHSEQGFYYGRLLER